MSNVAILDKTICINLVCTLWSGRRRLAREDLGVDPGSLPPEDLASIGSLKLCDPKRLTKLNSIKRAAERDCDRVCVRFLSGYATDQKNEADLVTKLTDRKRQFEEQAREFVSSLHTEFDQWIAQHPQHEALIRKALPNVADVASRLSFDFQIYRVGAVNDSDTSSVNQGLVKATGGLSGRLFAEIEAEAKSAWKRTYDGKDVVGQKALRPIRAIREKMHALKFLDARVLPLIRHIDTVLGAVPKAGKVEGAEFLAVVGLLRMLCDSEQMAQRDANTSQDPGEHTDDVVQTASIDELPLPAVGGAVNGDADESTAAVATPPEDEVAATADSHWF
jgi:uncharacterized protein DUF3150